MLWKGTRASKDDDHNHGYDDLPSALAPTIRELCDAVECGKGRCVPTIPDIKYPLGYKCECDPGWTRIQLDLGHDHHVYDDALVFMPCVIPNCTMNYTCLAAPPQVPIDIPLNESLYDPCYWTYCGEGTCIKNSTIHYRCSCQPGFYNLVNVSHFPCYSDCTLGSDSSSLGIKVSNAESDDVNDVSDDDDRKQGVDDDRNQAIMFLSRKFQSVAIFIAVVFALWQ